MCADWGIDSMAEYPELEVPMPMATVSLTRRRGDAEKDAENNKRKLEVSSGIPAFAAWDAETAEKTEVRSAGGSHSSGNPMAPTHVSPLPPRLSPRLRASASNTRPVRARCSSGWRRLAC